MNFPSTLQVQSNDPTEINKALNDLLSKINQNDQSTTASSSQSIPAAYNRAAFPGLVFTYVDGSTFTVSAGAIANDTFTTMLSLSSTITKKMTPWTIGNGGGCLDAPISPSTWYYGFIETKDDGTSDIIFSKSSSAPLLSNGYSLKRIVGAFLTDASSNLVKWLMHADGEQVWPTLTSDISDAGTLTTARKSYPVLALPNIPSKVSMNLFISNASSDILVNYTGDPSFVDAAPSQAGPITGNILTNSNGFGIQYVTDFYMLGQTFYARSSAATTTLKVSIISFNIRPYN